METGGIDSVLPQGRRVAFPTSPWPVDLESSRSTSLQRRKSMCPACLATVALVVTGATSAGGLTALAVNKLRARTGASAIATIQPGGEQDGGQPHRDPRRVARGSHTASGEGEGAHAAAR